MTDAYNQPQVNKDNIMEHMKRHHSPYADDGRVVSDAQYALIVHETDHEDYQGHVHVVVDEERLDGERIKNLARRLLETMDEWDDTDDVDVFAWDLASNLFDVAHGNEDALTEYPWKEEPPPEPQPWEGTISVWVAGEFTYYVQPDWKAEDASHAKAMVETELTDYLGGAFQQRRFKETWLMERVCTMPGCGMVTEDPDLDLCKYHIG